MRTRIERIAGDDIKAQLNEYHVLVAEVLGGIDGEMTEQLRRLEALETRFSECIARVSALERSNRMLVEELVRLRAVIERAHDEPGR